MKKEFKIRDAEIKDIDFLVETIIEAEKSGTDKLSYSTIFGITEDEVCKYLKEMLLEEIDGCELSVSSFLIAECEGNTAAAVSAWIEGKEGTPSAVLKGNLLNYILPKKCIEKAASLNEITKEIHIEYIQNTIQLGAGYVASEYRGHKLLGLLITEIIEKLRKEKSGIPNVWAQIFSCNIPSIKIHEGLDFKHIMTKESQNSEISNYLPSNKKFLFTKNL